MNCKIFARVTLGIFLSAALLWAGDPWKDKPWTQWTEKEVQHTLNDSPWAHRGEVAIGKRTSTSGSTSPADVRIVWQPVYRPNPQTGQPTTAGTGGSQPVPVITGGGGSTTVTSDVLQPFIVKWVSSRTVREAMVRGLQLKRNWTEEQARRALAVEPRDYEVVVERLFFAEKDAALKDTYLETGQGRRIPPVRVEDLEMGQRKIGTRFLFLRELDGKPTIPIYENSVTFCSKYGGEKIKKTFDLTKMVRDGKPDL